MIVLFTTLSYSTNAVAQVDSFPKGRVTATGDEPNGDGQDIQAADQAGVTVLGAGTTQSKICKDCQTSGNLILSSQGRRASPGIQQQTGAGGSSSGGSSSSPVDTSN